VQQGLSGHLSGAYEEMMPAQRTCVRLMSYRRWQASSTGPGAALVASQSRLRDGPRLALDRRGGTRHASHQAHVTVLRTMVRYGEEVPMVKRTRP